MILSAIILQDHFLFENTQIANLGGAYLYYIDQESNQIRRRKNERYISHFYAEDTITNLTAIVGRNGVGKTSLLKTLIEIRHGRYAAQYCLLYERRGQVYIESNGDNLGLDFEYQQLGELDSETLYYSPFLDFKEPNEGIDLSYDAVVSEDLEDINELYVASSRIDPLRNLKMKNWLRQLEFQNSEHGKQLAGFFNFPEHNLSRISFTRHKIDVERVEDQINFHNTPEEFRDFLNAIYAKIKKEAKEINENRKVGIINVQKGLFKNYILMDFLCILIMQMEKENTYLNEGRIGNKLKLMNVDNLSSLESFKAFLDVHQYVVGKQKIQILPVAETKKFLDFLYDIIDTREAKDDFDTRQFDWNSKALYLTKEEVVRTLEHQNDFLNQIDRYYGGMKQDNGQLTFSENGRINELVNFEPSDRSLSSGENALLNFYSRVHYYFVRNITKFTRLVKHNHYFLLLDEADLGFHPRWKKKFVSSILEFIRHYFSEQKAEVQIIFTTHDPLTLSDLLSYNIVYIDNGSGKSIILGPNAEDRPQRSFAANITDLLSESFYVDDGLIGDFAKQKIEKTIEWLGKESKENSEYYGRVIQNIDEPIVQLKLAEMYDRKMEVDLRQQLIRNQIESLKKLLEQQK